MSDFSVPIEEAMARLVIQQDYDAGNGPEPCVHTFLSSGFGLIGAHWTVESIRTEIETHGVEESGDAATATGHCLVIPREGNAPIFLEARSGS